MSVSEVLSSIEVKVLATKFECAGPAEILAWTADTFPGRAAIGTSFQGAGLVTIHQAVTAQLDLPVFTIDTGLLFPETLELKSRLEKFFGIDIETIEPELTVKGQARELGANLWERNPNLCFTIRKVRPFNKNLSTLISWIRASA